MSCGIDVHEHPLGFELQHYTEDETNEGFNEVRRRNAEMIRWIIQEDISFAYASNFTYGVIVYNSVDAMRIKLTWG